MRGRDVLGPLALVELCLDGLGHNTPDWHLGHKAAVSLAASSVGEGRVFWPGDHNLGILLGPVSPLEG